MTEGVREVAREAYRHSGPRSDEGEGGNGATDRPQIVIGQCIYYRNAHTASFQLDHARANRVRAARDDVVADVADLQTRLSLQYANEVRIAHWRQRMVAHARFAQQAIADEKMPLIDRAPVLRESRARDRELAAEGVHQGFGDGAYIASRCRIERRAVLEIDLAASGRAQPFECRE